MPDNAEHSIDSLLNSIDPNCRICALCRKAKPIKKWVEFIRTAIDYNAIRMLLIPLNMKEKYIYENTYVNICAECTISMNDDEYIKYIFPSSNRSVDELKLLLLDQFKTEPKLIRNG